MGELYELNDYVQTQYAQHDAGAILRAMNEQRKIEIAQERVNYLMKLMALFMAGVVIGAGVILW